MGKFNFKNYGECIRNTSKSPTVGRDIIDMDIKDRVIMLVLKSFLSETDNFFYYPSGLDEDVRKFIKKEPQFIANISIYAREELKMRRIALILACELAQIPEGKPYVREVMNKIIKRPDDMTEMMEYIY